MAESDTTTPSPLDLQIPSEADRERAKWALLQAQIRLAERQGRWETPRALAMIVLALAAIFAAGGVAGWLLPAHPQQITVHLDQPLVKVEPK